MTVPRKHAEVIKAWADGAEIECRWPWTNSQPGKWSDWYPSKEPSWNPNHEYRVVLKPQPRRYEEIIKAYYVDNKEIQYRCKDGDTYSPWSTWCGGGINGTFTAPDGRINNPKYEFRIKPIPLVLYGKFANPRHVGSSNRSTKHVLDDPCWTKGMSSRDNVCATFEDGVLVKLELLK